MRENTDWKNSEYEHFLRSVIHLLGKRRLSITMNIILNAILVSEGARITIHSDS